MIIIPHLHSLLQNFQKGCMYAESLPVKLTNFSLCFILICVVAVSFNFVLCVASLSGYILNIQSSPFQTHNSHHYLEQKKKNNHMFFSHFAYDPFALLPSSSANFSKYHFLIPFWAKNLLYFIVVHDFNSIDN